MLLENVGRGLDVGRSPWPPMFPSHPVSPSDSLTEAFRVDCLEYAHLEPRKSPTKGHLRRAQSNHHEAHFTPSRTAKIGRLDVGETTAPL